MAGRGRQALLAALIGAACQTPNPAPNASQRATAARSASAAPLAAPQASATTAAASELPPLSEPAELVKLAVPGFGDAVVSLPLGAVEPRHIAVALHGNFDRPEW